MSMQVCLRWWLRRSMWNMSICQRHQRYPRKPKNINKSSILILLRPSSRILYGSQHNYTPGPEESRKSSVRTRHASRRWGDKWRRDTNWLRTTRLLHLCGLRTILHIMQFLLLLCRTRCFINAHQIKLSSTFNCTVNTVLVISIVLGSWIRVCMLGFLRSPMGEW